MAKIVEDVVWNKDMKLSERLLLILIVLEKKREDQTPERDSQITTLDRNYQEKERDLCCLFDVRLNADAYRVN